MICLKMCAYQPMDSMPAGTRTHLPCWQKPEENRFFVRAYHENPDERSAQKDDVSVSEHAELWQDFEVKLGVFPGSASDVLLHISSRNTLKERKRRRKTTRMEMRTRRKRRPRLQGSFCI